MTDNKKDNKSFDDIDELLKEYRPDNSGKLPEKFEEGKILTFLENNNQRLKKASHFYKKQTEIISKYHQGKKIIDDMEKRNSKIRKSIIEVISKPDSIIQNNLAAIFNSYLDDIKNK